MSEIPGAPMKGSVVGWFARNPVVGALAALASIIGVPLAIVLFFVADKHRDIVYLTSPSPTTIVKKGRSSDLKIFFRDAIVTDDVSTMQIAIWNQGSEPSRAESILSKTVRISIVPAGEILDFRIKRMSRNVTNFKCEREEPQSVSCSWDILERNDGAVIELIYLGASGRVAIEGTIEGDKGIRKAAPSRGFLVSVEAIAFFLILAPMRWFSKIERAHRLGIFGFILYTLYTFSVLALTLLAIGKIFTPSAPFDL